MPSWCTSSLGTSGAQGGCNTSSLIEVHCTTDFFDGREFLDDFEESLL